MARTKAGVSPHRFGQVPAQTVPRSTFNLSHGLKTAFDVDYLVPTGVWDVIPGDSWNVKTTTVARLATPLHPIQDSLYIDSFYFFVPYRILWENFERFMGSQTDPTDSIDYTIPAGSGGVGVGLNSLMDYMGMPLGLVPANTTVSCLPQRAYYRIWNEWFRDENLQTSNANGTVTDDGPDALQTTAFVGMLKRAKKHDYFTSALPWPQKQTSGVELPLQGNAPVRTAAGELAPISISIVDGIGGLERDLTTVTAGIPITTMNVASTGDPLYADLSAATGATINQLRLAFQTQKLLERDARSGTRYVETLKAHWGVTFPDYTAQRPVYLGGGSQTIGITPVPQTTASPTTPTEEDAQGNLGGYGYSAGQSGFTKSFVEHGVIIALANGRGDITYSEGIDRYWTKQTRYDFYYPVLSGIGEQSILGKEIVNYATGTGNDDVFGYTGRYNEYRYLNSKLTGLMRPAAPNTLASWNLSEEFTTRPTLGNTFIQANTATPLDRAIAVPSEPHFIVDIWHDIKAARPLPIHGIPGQGMNF